MKKLFGELNTSNNINSPDIHLTNTSHIINNIDYDENKDLFLVDIEILKTKKGLILLDSLDKEIYLIPRYYNNKFITFDLKLIK